MAINIENRYRGLRAPHKLKLAVSGCARECAEAQGKDVGVIATEKGWNLYVGGNGGAPPPPAPPPPPGPDPNPLIPTTYPPPLCSVGPAHPPHTPPQLPPQR